jgi:competence protein ComFC
MISGQIIKRLFLTHKWTKWRKDAFHLVFPSKCIVCDCEWSLDNQICSFCSEEFVYTHFELYKEPTDLDKLFWGRITLEGTFALLYFLKGTSTQKLLHALKYQNKPEMGLFLGKEIAKRVRVSSFLSGVDVIIPVPLHPKKEFQRGYNQSEQLAKGISEITAIPIDKQFIKKLSHSGSQTKRGRFQRWDNVSGNFGVLPKSFDYSHILLVDDVITTGATIEALVTQIRKSKPALRISIVSLAVTK